MTDIRDLVDAIKQSAPDAPFRLRQGVIDSVQADGTATVKIGGSPVAVAGIKVSSSVSPVPGTSCWLATDGVDWFVFATLAPKGPAWGTMRQSAVQSMANAAFTAYSWTNRADVVTHGVTAQNDGLKVLVPGVYSIAATPTFSANATGQRHSQITVNGVVVSQGVSTTAPSTNICRLNCSTILKLAINDVVNVNAYQNSGAALNTDIGNGTGTLAVTWLGPAA